MKSTSFVRTARLAVLLAASFGSAAIATTKPIPEPRPAVFNFTVGANTNVVNGNSKIFTATSPDLGTYQVRATAWNLDSSNVVRASQLWVYSGGLGVISPDDQGGANAQHTIDNSKRKDFIILQFDRQVKLTGAQLNTFSVLGGTRDSDIIVKYGTTAIDWRASLGGNLEARNVSALNAMFSGTMTSNSTSTGDRYASLNPDRFSGDIWMIGAAWNNPDNRIDGFKLGSLAAIPEPATWAMMIGGFGMVGGALRRRALGAVSA